MKYQYSIFHILCYVHFLRINSFLPVIFAYFDRIFLLAPWYINDALKRLFKSFRYSIITNYYLHVYINILITSARIRIRHRWTKITKENLQNNDVEKKQKLKYGKVNLPVVSTKNWKDHCIIISMFSNKTSYLLTENVFAGVLKRRKFALNCLVFQKSQHANLLVPEKFAEYRFDKHEIIRQVN